MKFKYEQVKSKSAGNTQSNEDNYISIKLQAK